LKLHYVFFPLMLLCLICHNIFTENSFASSNASSYASSSYPAHIDQAPPDDQPLEKSHPCQIAYVISPGSHEITPIDLLTNMQGTPIQLDQPPHRMAVSPDGQMAYVIHEGSNQISCIKLASGQCGSLIFLEDVPTHIATAADGKTLFVTYQESNQLVPIDLESLTAKSSVFLPDLPHISAITLQDSKTYIVYDDSKAVAANIVLHPKQELIPHFVATIAPAGQPSYFDASRSVSLGSSIENYCWDFGDNSSLTSKIPVVSHTYQAPGAFLATLTTHEHLHNFPLPLNEGEAVTQPSILEASHSQLIDVPASIQTSQADKKNLKSRSPAALVGLQAGAGESTTTSLMISPASPSVYGQNVTFTGTVTFTSTPPPSPTGTVTFYNGATSLGSGTLNGSGVATFSSSTLAPDTYNDVYAAYNGDSNFNSSTSSPSQSYTVDQAQTTTTLTPSYPTPNPSLFGQQVTFEASVSANSPSTATPTGTMDFYYNGPTGTLIGSTTLSSGLATLHISSLNANTYPTITAVYVGNTDFATSYSISSPSVTMTVQAAQTSTLVSSTVNPTTYGGYTTFSATVTATAPAVGTPTGTVQFYDGVTPLGSPATLSGGGASLPPINSLSGGTHTITAVYTPNSTNFVTSTSPDYFQVVEMGIGTDIIITASQSPTEYGQPIELEAIVVGSVNNPPLSPSGTISFWVYTTSNPYPGTLVYTSPTIPAVPDSNTISATAILGPPTYYFDVGNYTFYAKYSGDVNYSASNSYPSSVIDQQVVQTETTTTMTSSSNCTDGSSATFTVTVAANPPGAGTPTGEVILYDGVVQVGSGTLNEADPDQATITVTSLSVGTHLFTAIYQGDSNFDDSTGPTTSITVAKDSTVTSLALTSGTDPSTFGESLTFTATVTPGCGSNTTVPTGTVTFYDGSSTVIGTAPVTGSSPGPYTATLTLCNLFPGASGSDLIHNLTAAYGGDANFDASSQSSPPLAQTVNGTLPTATTITASSSNPVAIAPNTTDLTATVVLSPDVCSIIVPTGGTASFYKEGSPAVLLGTAPLVDGSALLTGVSFADPGCYDIQAIYNPGTAPFIASSSPYYVQQVAPYATVTTLTLTPSTTVLGEAILTATVTASGTGPFPEFSTSGTVDFSDGSGQTITENVPPGSTGAFSVSVPATCFESCLVTATYSGEPCPDGNFATSSGSLTTSVTVAVSGSAPYYLCQPVTFTATVTSSSGTPTGTVTFYDGENAIGTAVLDGSGTATLEVTTFLLGTHSITATYNSYDYCSFCNSSNTIDLTLVTAPSTTTLTMIPPTGTVYGGELIFGAQVASPAGIPTTGSVIFSDENGTLAIVLVDAKGQALYSTDLLGAGTHTFTATYNSDCCSTIDPCFSGSTQSISYTISRVLPDVTLTATPTTVTYGDVITLNATVTSYSVGTPTGTVSYYIGSTFLGTAPIVNGMASLPVSTYLSNANIPPGANVIFNAIYSGDTNFLSTSSPDWLETINQAPVKVSLYSESPNPSFFGETIHLTATVATLLNIPTDSSITSIPPTGSITFYIDGATGSSVALVNGVATLSDSALSVGTAHSIYAEYTGNSYFLTNNSPTYTQQVEKVDTETTVTSSANPSTYNTSPTFTATVTSVISGEGTPTGTVTAYYGSYSTGAINLISGAATFTIPNLQPGVDTVIVQYSGSSDFNPSTGIATQAVNQAATSMMLTSSLNPSYFGDPVTFTATISPTSVTGTVSFFDGTTLLAIQSSISAGVATFTTSSLAVGGHTITAVYSGNAGDAPSTASLTAFLGQNGNPQVVNQVSPGNIDFTLTATPTSVTYGDVITLNAILTSSSGTPTGSVSFYLGTSSGTFLGTAPIAHGLASLPVSNYLSNVDIPPGTPVAFTATYSGDATFNPATSNTFNETINKAPVTISLVSESPNPSFYGDQVTLTATVASLLSIPTDSGNSPVGIPPTGTITFYIDGATGPTGALVNGVATLSDSALAVGTAHSIYAEYSGDSNFLINNSSTYSQQVEKVDTDTTVTSSANPSTYNTSPTFTATITSVIPGEGTPTGSVTAFYGSYSTGAINLISGAATFTIPNLQAGTDTIIVQYSGSNDFNPSTGIATQTVNQAATTTTGSSSPTSPTPVFGQPVTLTATVTSGAGTPTGVVSFSIGSTDLGVATLSSGMGSITLDDLPVGTTAITVTYLGSGNFAGSAGSVSPTVDVASTTTTLVSSFSTPYTYGQTVTFTANVVPTTPGAGTPMGTVTFSDTVAGTLGTVNLGIGGIATFTPAPTVLATGSHSITAVYNPSANFVTSTSSAVAQTIDAANTVTIVYTPSADNPSALGGPGSIDVTVNAVSTGLVVPDGTVQAFYAGSAISSAVTVTAGVISVPITLPNTAGAFPIVVVYTPGISGNFTGSSGAMDQLVDKTATSLTLTSSLNPSNFGQSVTFTVTINSTSATGTVSFFDGTTLLAVQSSISAGVATFSTSNLAVGDHTITAVYSGDASHAPSNASLTAHLGQNGNPQVVNQVTPGNIDFTLSATPTSVTYGDLITLNATVTSTFGTPTGSVSFYLGTSPSGTFLGTAPIANGLASLPVSNYLSNVDIPPGTPVAFTAHYSGDATFNPATSNTFNETINKAPVTISLVSESPNPSFYGETINLTATVASLLSIPTDSGNSPVGIPPMGTVTFYIDDTPGSPVTLVDGVATLSVSNLSVGPHTITVHYNGDTNFLANSSSLPTYTQEVEENTTTTVTSSSNPSTYNAPPTFSVTVAPVTVGAGTPTGTVTAYYGTTTQTQTLNGSGHAQFTMQNLPPDAYTIIFQYAGDGNFNPSTGSIIQIVNLQGTTTSITTNSPSPSVVGQTVTFTATVTATLGSPTPTGTVTFYDTPPSSPDDLIPIATATLNGSAEATITTAHLTLSTPTYHIITAVYNGNIYFSSSQGTVQQPVNQSTTSTSVTSSPTGATYGDPVTLTATVLDSSGNPVTGGTVTFTDSSGTVIGTASVVDGTATYTSTTIPVGTTVTANYGGTPSDASSSGVTPSDPVTTCASTLTTVISQNPNPSVVGAPGVTFIAMVTASDGSQLPNLFGTVSFYSDSTQIGTAQITNGIAALDYHSFATNGVYTIQAEYNGEDTNYCSSALSMGVVQTVNLMEVANTSLTTVTSDHPSPPGSDYGCPVVFTVTIAPLNIPAPTACPTGLVNLYSGGALIGSLSLSSGTCTDYVVTVVFPAISDLPAGTQAVTALYLGDPVYSQSTATIAQTVNPLVTTLDLTSSSTETAPNVYTSVFSQSVTFTATVMDTNNCSNPPAVTTGLVSFYDGACSTGTLLGTSPLGVNGVAIFTTDALSTASHTISACYNDYPTLYPYVPNFNPSSASITQNVTCIQTDTAIFTSAPNPSIAGEEITFIASVSIAPDQPISPEIAVPIGTVTFYDEANPVALGIADLINGFALLQTSTLTTIGTHHIAVFYTPGSANYCPTPLPLSYDYQQVVVVPVLSTNTVVTSSLNPAMFGDNVVFTATVTDPTHMGIPTGTVTFFDGYTAIGTAILVNGVAEISTSTLSIGNHPITAVYSGDADYHPSTSSVYTEVIIASTYPLPPHDFYGCQVINKYLNFDDIVNVLTWLPPQDDHTHIVRYEIYRNPELTDLCAVVGNECPYRFEDGNRKKKRTYEYYIVSVNAEGHKSPAVHTKVIPHHKDKKVKR
jgi:hypothetical protein